MENSSELIKLSSINIVSSGSIRDDPYCMDL